MKGIAQSYHISSTVTDLDTSSLYLHTQSPLCSAIFFPSALSQKGDNFYAVNRDYYKASRSEVMGEKKQSGEKDMLTELYIMEIKPDEGYHSLAVGSLDLVSGGVDLINSQGLGIAILEDDTYGMENIQKDLSLASGLSPFQLARLIIDTCKNTQEAKEAILTNRMSMMLMPVHFIVMDLSGQSFIYERSKQDNSDHFVDNLGKPQTITNHAVSSFSDVTLLPKTSKEDPYDTFDRYLRLEQFVDSHTGTFSHEDGEEAMKSVYGYVNEASEGGFHELPLRTLSFTA